MKKRGILAGLALAAALMLGMSVPAFAADYGQGDPATTQQQIASGNAKVTKVLHTNEGSTVTATFSFTATGTTVDTGNGGTSEATAGLIPTIADVTLTSDGTGADQTDTGAITFPNYTHAGVYAYLISESQTAQITNADGTDGAMTYDTTQYLMRVYVENDAGGVTIKTVTFEKGMTGAANGERVDGDNVKFENTFTEKNNPTPTDPDGKAGPLTITKTVTGGAGDQSKDWNFTVTFTAPANVPAGWTVASITAIAADGSTVAAPVTGTTATFTLKHGQTYKFNNIVLGTKYTVSEAEHNTDGYTTTGEVANATTIVDSAANGATITNNKEPITPTGLVVNNMPFILMGLVAIAGLVVYGAAKRRLER